MLKSVEKDNSFVFKKAIKLSADEKQHFRKVERSLSNYFEAQKFARANSLSGLSSHSGSSSRSNSSIKIKNYGHSRKSNLQEKAIQMKKMNRSRSVVSELKEESRIEVVVQSRQDKTEKSSKKKDDSNSRVNSSNN
jgi:hypothetical protein